ncbi:hypothetical protein NMY22_g8896 [Coprinellus aureogranulatus]|nr:hypothetical protein NMY22_g8896 [Coprinellus aureogranulatus]
MSGAGAPPVIPTQFLGPNYTEIDSKFQRIFTATWAAVLGTFIVVSLPGLFRAVRNGRAFRGIWGIAEVWDSGSRHYSLLPVKREAGARGGKLGILLNRLSSWFCLTMPKTEVNLGQLLVLGGYAILLVVCITVDAALVKNANRAGRIAVAQIPIVFLFSTKNSIVSLLLGPGHGYEKLSFVHKWSGRGIFLGSLIHGVLWIVDHLKADLPIIGQQKEETGIAAFALLCTVVITSLRPIRRRMYTVFYNLHILLYTAFFITMCYHTPEAIPWIFPALAFYGLDQILRMFHLRIKDAILVPIDRQMTLVHIPDCTDGWTAGQHIRLRVISGARALESHPFTILTAPPEISCVTSLPQGVNLGVRVMGDWTQALNDYATQTKELVKKEDTEACHDEQAGKQEATSSGQPSTSLKPALTPDIPVQVMLDGPYGGCSVDLGRYESVLLFAGGAGATFTLGLLDDIVGRCVKLGRREGEVTKRIEFSWCIKSFGAIDWFASALVDIATLATSPASDLSVHISIYVTCLCNPEAVPSIPNCDVTVVRPSIYQVLMDLITPPGVSTPESLQALRLEDGIELVLREPSGSRTQPATAAKLASVVEDSGTFDPSVRNRLPWIGLGGGLAVCASGPESLTREAANAVARLQMRSGLDLGIVGLHTEVFSL